MAKLERYPISILKYPRAEVFAATQQGIMNIKSLDHWDICNALKNGKSKDQVCMEFDIDERHVRYIKQCKCPDV